MIVAIQKGIEGLKSDLVEKGYRVVYYDEYPHPIDAYIYVGYSDDIGYSGGIFTNSTSCIGHSTTPRYPGVLHINVRKYSLNEITRLLSAHSYSHSLVFSL